MSTWLYLFTLQLCFVLKLSESLIKSLKITAKKIVNPYWSAGKLLIHQKNLFEMNNFTNNDLNKL